MKKLASTLFFCGVATFGAGCASGVAHQSAATPEWQPEGQYKCKVSASKAEPLVVEWPSADRAKLEALTKQGIVAVKYNGCEMQVMGACTAKGHYRYVGTTLKRDAVHIRDADELYAKLPFGAANLESTLKQSGQLDVSMSLVGRYTLEQPVIHETELSGACTGATHVISALTVGAFEFSARGARTGKDRASVFESAAGSTAESEKQVLTSDGDEPSCLAANDADAEPPAGCRALIRVEVLSLPEAEARSRAAAAAAAKQLEEERAARGRRRTVGWVVGGVGLASALTSGFFALSSSSSVSDIRDGGSGTSRDIEQAHANAESAATIAWITGGIGVAALGAAAVLLWTAREPNGEPNAMQAARPGTVLRW